MRPDGLHRRHPAFPRRFAASAFRRTSVVVLASEFHPRLARRLVDGAVTALRRHGIPDARIRVIQVPGAFELPVVAARVAASRAKPDAIIALGALIRGQTPQYAILAQAVAQGLTQVAVSRRIPVTFGLVVAETLSQARARAGGARGNRGEEAALAALAVLKLLRRVT